MLIGRNADGIVMVIEEGRTTARDVKQVLRLLSPTRIVGSVLNKSITARRDRYGYDYYEAP